jgi:heptosyltransferase-2
MNHHSPAVVIPIMAGIGNALLAVPMVQAIKAQFPAYQITILARSNAMGEVFSRLPEVSEVIITGNGARGIIRCIAQTRRRRAELYLGPFPSNRWQYSMLALTSGAKRKLLHRYPIGHWRAMHFIGERTPAIRGIHDVRQNLNLLTLLGCEPRSTEPPSFAVNADDERAADQSLTRAGVAPASQFIAVHAGSAKTVLAKAKRWPTERYANLIDQLRQRYGQVVLLEGPDERGVVDEIVRAVSDPPKVVHLDGPLSTAAAILQRARLYVGSDSGLAHLAAAVGTPAVTIFAAADPDRVCPFGYRHLVVRSPSETSPSFLYPWEATRPRIRPGGESHIRQITVEMVLEKVELALAAEPTAQAMNQPPREGARLA